MGTPEEASAAGLVLMVLTVGVAVVAKIFGVELGSGSGDPRWAPAPAAIEDGKNRPARLLFPDAYCVNSFRPGAARRKLSRRKGGDRVRASAGSTCGRGLEG